MEDTPKNILETALGLLPKMADVQNVATYTADQDASPACAVVAIPSHMVKVDISAEIDRVATYLQPWRRSGKAMMQDLQSLVDWANRHKGETSALFADTASTPPTLTCIADYIGAGAPVMDAISRDPNASHCRHRATYSFPISREWRLWNAISGKPLGKAELGEFVETNAKDMLLPSTALMQCRKADMADWELSMALIAQQVQGRFGAPDTLIALSRRFEVNERSNISATRNPDTGEASFVFINEHQQPDGNPIQIPNLFLIALPVFDNGALYRLPVRFRYQKSGSDVKFFLTLHNPDIALRDALDEALEYAHGETDLPLFRGLPEF